LEYDNQEVDYYSETVIGKADFCLLYREKGQNKENG
jgi:hypothetical protein